MNAHEYLSNDGHALLALCSAFALPETAAADGLQPFKLSEWNQLDRQIRGSSLKIPGALRGCSGDKLAAELTISAEDAGRIVRLLDRAGQLAMELDQLFFGACGLSPAWTTSIRKDSVTA